MNDDRITHATTAVEAELKLPPEFSPAVRSVVERCLRGEYRFNPYEILGENSTSEAVNAIGEAAHTQCRIGLLQRTAVPLLVRFWHGNKWVSRKDVEYAVSETVRRIVEERAAGERT
jgi:hypothetical protein